MSDESKGPGGVVVVGGGVVGCAAARAIASAGGTVSVVDPGRPEMAATWAAGGMLSPLGEAPAPGPFLELALRSRSLWPGFASDLETATGLDLGLRLDGKLLAAFDDAGLGALARRRRWQVDAGFDVRWLDGTEVGRMEPGVSSRVAGGLLLPRDGAVDNRTLGRALRQAARAAGCRLVTGATVKRVEVRGGRVRGVRLEDGTTLRSTAVVVAAGAWSGTLAGLPRPLPVRPVRGQMLSFRLPEAPVRRVVAADVYLIPRLENGEPRLLVGATTEEAGFQRHTTPDALARLREGAVRLVPSLADAEVAESWAGLRPGTPDDLPILGPDPEVEGLVYATGHYRNGILLAPVTAGIVAAAVSGREPAGLEAFRADRFE